MSNIVAERALAYITYGDRLLVFRHTQFPEAGIQVPAGMIKAGESPREAVLREASEESGLKDLEIRSFLGTRDLDLAPYGQDGLKRCHYFHLLLRGEAPVTWRHYEMDPSDDSPAPIEFEFFWVKFPDGVPELADNQEELLSELGRSLGS